MFIIFYIKVYLSLFHGTKNVKDKCLLLHIQKGNGIEFILKKLDEWTYEYGVGMVFSRPGKPEVNPFIESSGGNLRD